MLGYSEKDIRKALSELRSRVEDMKAAYCPQKYPYVLSIEPDKQLHPEFRKGALNACNAVLRRITKIEQALFSPDSQKSHTTRCKPQSAPVHQCCKDTHNQVNLTVLEPSDQPLGCTNQCAQKRCKNHFLTKSQSSHGDD